jgi:hypothetical protein
MRWLAITLALACNTPEPQVQEAPPAETQLVLSDGARAIFERSLIRDPEPSCAELTEGIADPVSALLEVAERVQAPPRSGMRAATCLVREHASAIEPTMTRWVSERRTMGYGLLALDHLDRFPPELADRLSRAALAGDFPDAARRRIERRTIEHEEPGTLAP